MVDDTRTILTTASPPLSRVLDLALARTAVVRDVEAAVAAHQGLGINDLALLLEVAGAPGRRIRRVDLARRLGITTAGLARQLGPLETIGVVDREANPRDARLVLVVLTPAGAELAQNAARTPAEASERVLASVWSAAEERQLSALVTKIRHRG